MKGIICNPGAKHRGLDPMLIFDSKDSTLGKLTQGKLPENGENGYITLIGLGRTVIIVSQP